METQLRDQIPVRKLGRLSKAYLAGKLLPLTECMGGNVFHEGKLYMLPSMEKDEITKLSTSRRCRLIRDEDDYVVGLEELEEIQRGHFYNVQEDAKKADFLRDDLVEPVDSACDISLYRYDLVLKSRRFRDKTDLTGESLGGSSYEPADCDAGGLLEEGSDSLVEGASNASEEKGDKTGLRAPITELTKKSSDKMKFTLRNSLCDFQAFITLTYPRSYPRDGRVCKKHLNLFLTHLRTDYKGIKYFWFMEFQERGAPHFHIFLSCPIPGRTYVSPLWYRVVNSGDLNHLKAGTNVVRLRSSKDVIRYATSYAKKLTQKMTPEDFESVGRFWGCSRKLCDAIMVLSDVSIRQVQELWATYYGALGFSGLRLDKLNGYIWDGRRYAAGLLQNYYEAHFRPSVAEVSMLSRAKVKPGKVAYSSEEQTDLLAELRTMKKRVSAGSSVWKDLTEEQFKERMRKGTVRAKELNNRYKHSLSVAYEGIDEVSYNASAISLWEWAGFLAYLQLRILLNWADYYKPLMKVLVHTHVTLCKDGRIHKRRYAPKFEPAVFTKIVDVVKTVKDKVRKRILKDSSGLIVPAF